jgi:hypothetical protein
MSDDIEIQRGRTTAGFMFFNKADTAQVVGVVAAHPQADLAMVGYYGLKGFLYPRETGTMLKLLAKDSDIVMKILKDLGLEPEGYIEL